MKFVNTLELKNHTNKLLRQVKAGPIAITRRGKPCAALIPLTEEGLEELAFEHSPTLRRLIAEAETDVRRGRVVTWDTFLKHERSRHR